MTRLQTFNLFNLSQGYVPILPNVNFVYLSIFGTKLLYLTLVFLCDNDTRRVNLKLGYTRVVRNIFTKFDLSVIQRS